MIRPWNENIWFSPRYVINELSVAVSKGRDLKRYEEAWICAVAFICHAKIDPAEWWIQIPENDPPDVLVMSLVPREDGKGQYLSKIQVEVFEIREFDDEDIQASIMRKLGQKDYSGVTVIGFVRRMTSFDHISISEFFQKNKPKVQALFLICFEENSTNISLIGLFPQCIKFKEDFGLFCKTTAQKDFVEMRRAMGSQRDDNGTQDELTLIPEKDIRPKR